MIDWGNLLEDNNSNFGPSSAHNSSSNTAPSSTPNTAKMNQKMLESLYGFYASIKELLNQIKENQKSNRKIFTILDNFLNIPNFLIYNSRQTANILNKKELDELRILMEDLIKQLN